MSGLEDFPDASGIPKAFLMPGTSRKYTFQGDCVSLLWHVTSGIPVLNTALLHLDTAIDTIRMAGVYIKSVAEIRFAHRRPSQQESQSAFRRTLASTLARVS